ncbi:hypothetical protein SK128_019311 [Halocaridina rubra]|uniref:BtpA family membrane complex biogenesis protein n=1 Tax=Halocaridina rubra TaxID=373956 RepID=A0AAN8ZYH8_HALRR
MAFARFTSLFTRTKGAVIGMVHVKPLPGTPLSQHVMKDIVEIACQEAEIYKNSGVDGILIENMFDLPYLQASSLGPETVACMTRVCQEVRDITPSHIPCGVQILAGGNKEAVAVSKACGLQFIRAECFVFSHVADEGLMNASAGSLLRYRRSVGAEDILIFTDIKKKHSAHAITSDVDIVEMAQAAQFFLADGVIITGSSTGQEADNTELEAVCRHIDLPILIGSGITKDNVHKYVGANAFIVGSHFKKNGKWYEDLEKDRVEAFINALNKSRE